MMEVEQYQESISTPDILSALFDECSAVTDYHTLLDSLPRRLAHLLKCRCVLFYQKIGDTLQFVSGTFDDTPGWSSALLSVVHINPVSLKSEVPEACAWRERRVVVPSPTFIASPLIYRQRCIGVLVAIRGGDQQRVHSTSDWKQDEIQVVEAVAAVVALLLENTRLLERNRERIHELSLLNSISSQMNCSLYEADRIHSIVLQNVREISRVEFCELIELSTPIDAVSWITPAFRAMLFDHFNEQRSFTPLVLERPGSDTRSMKYIAQLPETVQTFFAVPLLSALDARGSTLQKAVVRSQSKVLAIVVGAYSRPWKLRREESTLLQVLMAQASTVLENMRLMTEVIEARNQARKLLRQVLEDQRLKELILESIPSGLLTIDMKSRITTFNRAAEAILGYHPREVLGQQLHSLLNLHSSLNSNAGWHYSLSSASSRLPQDAVQSVLNTGEVRNGTALTTDRQGHELVLDLDVSPLRDDRGKQVGALITFVDVTSVHRLEEEKRRLDRLASLGEMAANVAHEVRNPLASIKTSIQMLVDDLEEIQREDGEHGEEEKNTRMQEAQESTSVMLKEVERLDTIVHDLLLFARPRQLHRVKCNLLELSDRVLQLMQMQCADANVEVHRLYEHVPSVEIDMGQIEQVLFNLYMNAVQAMSEGGVLTISCHVVPDEPTHGYQVSRSRPQKKHHASKQQWLELLVTDTGVGIPTDQLERIFQPFFTTKAHGIGLGLPITRRLVEDHGGSLHVESRFGYGTTIVLRLPLIASRQEEEDEGL